MFTDYYKLMHISSSATDEEISEALRRSTLSISLVEEMKMVLQNKSLKDLYDAELKLYETTKTKQDYQISNPILEREIKKITAYISNKAYESVEIKERKHSCLWIIVIFIAFSFIKGCMSYLVMLSSYPYYK